MAKKKKTSSRRATTKRTKKKAAKKTSQPRKSPAKKSTSKKSPAKKSPRKKTIGAKSSGASGKSVDGVLKKYEKERSAQLTQLATLRRKIEDLQTKTRRYQEQIAKLTDQENATEESILQLDSRRDEEVGNLLSKLGVQLGGGSSVSAFAAATYDENQPAEDAETDGDDSGADDTSDSDEDDDAESAQRSDAESADET